MGLSQSWGVEQPLTPSPLRTIPVTGPVDFWPLPPRGGRWNLPAAPCATSTGERLYDVGAPAAILIAGVGCRRVLGLRALSREEGLAPRLRVSVQGKQAKWLRTVAPDGLPFSYLPAWRWDFFSAERGPSCPGAMV